MAAEKKTGPMVMSTTTNQLYINQTIKAMVTLTDLHNEAGVIPRILPHQDSSHVTKDLRDTSKKHCGHESPSLVSPAKHDLYDSTETVECDEKSR